MMLKLPIARSWGRAVPFVGAAAVIGLVVVAFSFAAGPLATFEPELGDQNGDAQPANLAGASGGKVVMFSGQTTTPTPVTPGSCPQSKRTVTAAEVTAKTNSGYAAGTTLFVSDGPDPWGGCFPGPGTTGIPAGTQLTSYAGPCTITTPNTLIEAKNITCSLTIRAAGVHIKNSKITAGDIGVESGSLLLTDSEVNFGNNVTEEGLKGTNFTLRRANMYGGKRQVWCHNMCTVEDSYLHDQLSDPSGVTHESSLRVQENTIMRHDTLLCNAPTFEPDAGCSANQTGYPDFAPIHDNTMDKNLYMATTGGYCSYGGASSGKPYSTDPLNAQNIHATNNVFVRGTTPNDRTNLALTDKNRYTCGYYGATTAYAGSKPGFIFNGNRWDDGLLFASDSSYPYGNFTD